MVVVARSADVAEEEEEPVGGPGNVGSEAGSGRAATDEVPGGGGGGEVRGGWMAELPGDCN